VRTYLVASRRTDIGGTATHADVLWLPEPLLHTAPRGSVEVRLLNVFLPSSASPTGEVPATVYYRADDLQQLAPLALSWLEERAARLLPPGVAALKRAEETKR
jgi:hypothetical protein